MTLAMAALGLLLAGCGAGGEAKCDTPTGLPVPRFVSLKVGEVNARKGPGEDHRILWVWRAKGMPLEVVAETTDWRRVRGPDGALAWVHRPATDGRQTVMRAKPGPAPVRTAPHDNARIIAWLRHNAVAGLEASQPGWRRIRASGVTGWVRADDVWGAGGPTPCRPRGR